MKKVICCADSGLERSLDLSTVKLEPCDDFDIGEHSTGKGGELESGSNGPLDLHGSSSNLEYDTAVTAMGTDSLSAELRVGRLKDSQPEV